MLKSVRALTATVLLGIASTLAVVPLAAASSSISSTELLAELTVSAENTSSYYSPAAFPMWSAAAKCNTRGQVLWTEATKKPSVKGCNSVGGTMTGGTWTSPYDGVVLHHATQMTVDHLVPLSEAWRSGASAWNLDTRKRFANDLQYAPTLMAVSKSVAAGKGSSSPEAWLPPNAAYRCTYVKNWVAVKWRWQLSVDPDEKAFLFSSLTACGSPSLPIPWLATVQLASSSSGTSTGTTPPGTTPPPTTTPPTSGATVDLNGVIEIPYQFDVLTGSLPQCGGAEGFRSLQVGIQASLWSGNSEVGTGSITGCQWVHVASAPGHDYWSPNLSLRLPGVPNVAGLSLHIDTSPAVSLGSHLPVNTLVLVACDTNSNLLCVG